MKNEQQATTAQEHTDSQDSQNPEIMSKRKAGDKLRERVMQLDIIKRRLMVLKGQQQYNRFKTIDQQRKVILHNEINANVKREKESLEKQMKQIRDAQAKQLKEKHDKIQIQLRQNAEKVYGSMMSSRIGETKEVKQQSALNQRSIQKNKQQDLLIKIKQRKQIVAEKQRQRSLVKMYKNNRTLEVKSERSVEIEKINKMAADKDKQLKKLMKYEQEMLQRASQSIAANHRAKSEFSKVFEQTKLRNLVKLPSISKNSGKKSSEGLPGTGGSELSSYRSSPRMTTPRKKQLSLYLL